MNDLISFYKDIWNKFNIVGKIIWFPILCLAFPLFTLISLGCKK